MERSIYLDIACFRRYGILVPMAGPYPPVRLFLRFISVNEGGY